MNSPRSYRKRPVAVEAIKWTGANLDAIEAFVGDAMEFHEDYGLRINTLEGPHYARLGDMIIKGVKGECYPCKADIFEKTYLEVIG